MATTLATFAKQKDYLICVDSDGCAIDTMEIKHHTCFGPCMVEEWGLQQWAQPILARWNDINLYTMTRGINRFKGLAMALAEIDKQYTPIEGLPERRGPQQRRGGAGVQTDRKPYLRQGPALVPGCQQSHRGPAA